MLKRYFIAVIALGFSIFSAAHAASTETKELNQKESSECVYPGANRAAPLWICTAEADGYEVAVIGTATSEKGAEYKLTLYQSAFLNALGGYAESVITHFNLIDDVPRKSSASRQYSSINLGGHILIERKTYEYKSKDRVLVVSDKVAMDVPCTFIMRSYSEHFEAGVDGFQHEISGNCSFRKLEEEVSKFGLKVIETATSPAGEFFLLLGARKAGNVKIIKP